MDIKFYAVSNDLMAVYIDGQLRWRGHPGDLKPGDLLSWAGIESRDSWIPAGVRDAVAGGKPFVFPADEQKLQSQLREAGFDLRFRVWEKK